MSEGPWIGADDALRTAQVLGFGEREPDELDSWLPINLNSLGEKPPVPPTLGAMSMLYPGRRHVFSGPPESAKTLAAYIALIQVVRCGGLGILIDFEMGPYEARNRLRELGCERDEMDSIYFVGPDEKASSSKVGRLLAIGPDLVVVDASAGAFALEGLDDNRRGEVEKLNSLYVTPFWNAGIATLMIDHVVKDTESRGHYTIGSERKQGASDIHLGFEPVRNVRRGGSGLYKIITHKDRGGYLRRGHVADLELESEALTHQIAWTLYGTAIQRTEYDRPTNLMEKVSVYLKTLSEPVSMNTVTREVTGSKEWILKALQALIIEGFATEEEGPRGARLMSSTRPYYENDPDCNPEDVVAERLVLCGSENRPEPHERVVLGDCGSIEPQSSNLAASDGEPLNGDGPNEPEATPLDPDDWLGL